MQYYFTMDAGTPVTERLIADLIRQHRGTIPRLNQLDDYYTGHHAIAQREKKKGLSNNRLVCNHAKLIVDEAVGYFIGNPVTYKSAQQIDRLTEWLRRAGADTVDMDIAKDCAVFGRGFELLYMSSDDSPVPKLAVCDPRNAFVVYDTTVDRTPLLGVYYYPLYDAARTLTEYALYCSTPREIITGRLTSGLEFSAPPERQINPFGGVSIVQYWNNEEEQGDFEQVISLIDAYNVLQSDRVNDKEQFVQAVLVLYGATLGDDNAEKSETMRGIKASGVMELDEQARAEYLSHAMDEAGAESLRSSLAQDIHRFSGVPCMSDEQFAGNASGVAMRYKLLGFEQLTKIKERYFRDGLRRRLRLLCSVAAIKGAGAIDPDEIAITFTRALPQNELELAQMVQTLDGMVPAETLLAQLPFVDDPSAAAETVAAQRQASAARQQAAFALGAVDENAES